MVSDPQYLPAQNEIFPASLFSEIILGYTMSFQATAYATQAYILIVVQDNKMHLKRQFTPK